MLSKILSLACQNLAGFSREGMKSVKPEVFSHGLEALFSLPAF